MLEPWVINEIRRREEERRRDSRPRVYLPIPDSQGIGDGDPGLDRVRRGDRAPDRGVAIMEM